MSKISCALLLALFSVTSCASPKKVEDDLATWEQTMNVALLKAKIKEYNYILDHMLSQDLMDAMIDKYGAENWKTEFQNRKLKNLPYYFGWLKDSEVKMSEDKIFLVGQHGCYATFINVKGRYLILDFGQRVTSM